MAESRAESCGLMRAQCAPGIHVIEVPRATGTDAFITATPAAGEPPLAFLDRAGRVAAECGGHVVMHDIFGVPRTVAAEEALTGAFGPVTWPITWLEDGTDPTVAGTQLRLVRGLAKEPEVVREDGRPVAILFEDAAARYCRIADAHPAAPLGSEEDQTRATLELMERVLARAGMSYLDVVRTWFYNRDILDWYGAFNRTRNAFYTARNVFAHMAPASTGIGGHNPAGAALIGGALAVRPLEPTTRFFPVASPLQCPALDYGSAFSRAAELETATRRTLFVSGTASISPEGKTLFPDDVEAQIRHTLEVVGAILEARSIGWTDTVRAIAYFLRAEDAPLFGGVCREMGIGPMPAIVANNVVCRADLLFELELEAIQLR